MSVLNQAEIKRRMKRHSYDEKLVVTPLLSEAQLGPGSIDIRLGSTVIVPKKTYVDSQDLTVRSESHRVVNRLYEHSKLQYHTRFVLHPRQLILGVTFEYLAIPTDTFCTIMTRSSWGRLGLVVATAAAVLPGYKGSPTLELTNLGESPLVLYPGLPIAQLVCHDAVSEGSSAASYHGRYAYSTEAELPKFFVKDFDDELGFWGREKK